MSEKLTKTALKDELTRRIDWFEKSYKFNMEDGKPTSQALQLEFGRYCSLIDMRWQIKNNLFVGGYAS